MRTGERRVPTARLIPTGGAVSGLKRVVVSQWTLLVLFLGGAILWVPRLMASPLHEDEAIYAAWSLRLLRGDFWLWTTPVDKPPLTFYPIAGSVALFGQHDWAVRLPGLLWTLLLLWSVARIATRWERPASAAVLAALLSPLLWVLGVSAFTDVAMVALTFLALERLLAERPGTAGITFALAFLAKPTALLVAPLFAVALLDRPTGRVPARLHHFCLGAAAPLLLAWAWDASRTATSWWILGARAYGTLGQPSMALAAWLPGAALAAGAVTPLALAGAIRGWRPGVPRRLIWPLCLALLLWLPLHLLLGFQPWNRYLLPMVPVAALLASAAVPRRPAWRWHVPLALLALATPLLVTTYGLGHHDGRWTGIAAIGGAVEALPPEAVLLYRDTGRQLAWYAADATASLEWVGENWTEAPARMAPDSERPYYAVMRVSDRLPATLVAGATVARAAQFHLIRIDARGVR